MTIRVAVSGLSFSGGDVVAVPENGMLLIVGPNNVGKSVALREIVDRLTSGHHPSRPIQVVADLQVEKQGTGDDLRNWLKQHARLRSHKSDKHESYSKIGAQDGILPDLQDVWSDGPPFHDLATYFSTYLAAEVRLNSTGSVDLWDVLNDHPRGPLQLLYDTPEIEDELRTAARDAFGQDIFVNRYAGTKIHLQMGDPPDRIPPPAPPELMRELTLLPHVHEQGDGIKSFIGILLELLAGDRRILVVDEPEAFLHPPQARLLARKLSAASAAGKQVFAATHGADVVLGAMEAQEAAVTIVRLDRRGSINTASVLRHDQLRTLWSDPVLRHSNMLDGLFHRGVVACEGDGDALFLSAALDHFLTSRGLPSGEVLFTATSGKQSLYKAAAALKEVSVPVVLVADIDLVNDSQVLSNAVRSLGGNPSSILRLQKLILADITPDVSHLQVRKVRQALDAILRPYGPEDQLPRDAIDEARTALKSTSPWPPIKRAGLNALKGDTYRRLVELIDEARALGLIILDVGELESFDKGISGSKPEWVAQALTKEVHHQAAPQLVAERIAASLGLI